jgi:anti-sigma regulatory factor (Ser/Thr protein kinase)
LATVELRFTALPEHVRTARLVAVSLARRAGIDEESLDEVRLAVGEAASRAVGRHRASGSREPVLVRMTDGAGSFVTEVVDVAGSPDEDADADEPVGQPETAREPARPVAAGASADRGPVLDDAGDTLDDLLPPGVDLAVISGLVDDVEVSSGPGGSTVRMAWPVDANGRNDPSPFGSSNASA